jgi:hypothetical protein
MKASCEKLRSFYKRLRQCALARKNGNKQNAPDGISSAVRAAVVGHQAAW